MFERKSLLLMCMVLLMATLMTACATPVHTPVVKAPVVPVHEETVEVPPMSAETQQLLQQIAPESRDAFEQLFAAAVFQDKAIGYEGRLSENVKAYQQVANAPQAAELFMALAHEATTVGRLYGTIGLYTSDTKAFSTSVEALQAVAQENVSLQAGCLSWRTTVGELLENRSPQAIRLQPGQSLMDWFQTHKSGQMDIVGGAYPLSFAAEKSR